jgi:cation transport ATPase
MVLRIVGVAMALIGAIAVGIGIYGLSQTSSMMDSLSQMTVQSEQHFDPHDWAKHWVISSLIFVGIGAFVLAGGVALVLRNLWGLLLVAAGAVIAATYPWIFLFCGIARYVFESADTVETIIYMAITCAAVLAYVFRRHRRVGT